MQLDRFEHLKELETALWQASNEVRRSGKLVDPIRDLLAPLASLIFLRWASLYESQQESLGGSDYGRFLPGKFNWKSWSQLQGRDLRNFIQEELSPKLRALPKAGWGSFLHTMGNHIQINYLTDRSINTLVEQIDRLPLETLQDRQIIGEIFTRILQNLIKNQKYSGQFFTPPSVVELMVELASPQPGERIYDPCFGTGGLLVSCVNYLQDRIKNQSLGNWWELQNKSIYGIEINPFLYVIGMVRLMLAGIDNPALELGDTLEYAIKHISSGINLASQEIQKQRASGSISKALQRPQGSRHINTAISQHSLNFLGEGFDCILAVPPFSRMVNREVSSHFPIKGSSYTALFLQHIMRVLRPGGRAIVALPESILFNTSEERVRQEILEQYNVEGVLSLPSKSFLPYTGIKTSILIFSRIKPQGKVRFFQVHQFSKLLPIRLSQSSNFGTFLTENRLESELLLSHEVAQEFRKGELSEYLWETEVKKLSEQKWQLVSQEEGNNEFENFLQTVRSVAPNIPINQLKEVAEVFTGIPINPSSITSTPEEAQSKNLARVIRGSDITSDGKILLPSVFIDIEQLTQKQQCYQLQANDLLIPRIQSFKSPIKVGIVTQKLVGTVAANSLVVIRIRPDIPVLATYLSVLLGAPIYQNWIKNYASMLQGSVRLPVQELQQLAVPVPSLLVQESVAKRNWEGALNATRLLIACLTQEDLDQVADWLEADPIIQDVLNSSLSANKEANLALLLRISEVVESLRNKIAHSSSSTDPILTSWLLELASGLREMGGFEDIPPGTARLTVLTNTKLSLTKTLQILTRSDILLVKRARELTRGLLELVDRQIQEQVTDVRVEASLNPSVIPTATQVEVILTLHNIGVIPIRQFHVSTHPELGIAKIPYLCEGQRINVRLVIPPQEVEGMLNFVVLWSGKLLTGERIEHESPLTLSIKAFESSARKVDLGASPYIVGNPVDREEMFFGRSKVIEAIKRQLATPYQANVILLEGNRRTGKTSILKHFERDEKLPGWIVVNCSFQGGEADTDKVGLTTAAVFRLMAKQLGIAAHKAGLTVQLPDAPPYDPNRPFQLQFVRSLRQYLSNEYPFEDFEIFLQLLLDVAHPRRILFMLDEFDKLQEGIDSGVTNPQVPENIRYLFQTYSQLSGIITGSRRLKRLREEYWSVLFGLGYRIGLDPLELDYARQLVTEPVESRLVYVQQARDLAVELCARQPFLIQSLCNRIFERAVQTNQQTITLDAVQTAADEMVRDNEHFRTLWDYAGTERRRFILSLCHKLEPEPDPVTLALLEIKLEEAEVLIPSGERLGEDIEFLRELELLELDSTGGLDIYKLAIPLMGDWIKRNVDHEDQRKKAVQEGEEKF
ncbi:N-6 DNA methylase [Microcoleus sp. Pol11C1]|uniref:N-6 DNA methylase n=1 Tax=unclassified Microcoleus TaxID=2642155 RepID=UPI002FCEDEF2